MPVETVAAPSTKARRAWWDSMMIGIVFFFFGAFAMKTAMTYMFHHPVQIGSTRFQFFDETEVTNAFQQQYVKNWWDRTIENTRWLGVKTMTSPLDTWVFQEILYETKPDVFIETGTLNGGATYYYASIFDLLHRGRVLSVDIEDKPGKPQHDRITYFLGSSTEPAIVKQITDKIKPNETVMVMLDSDHEKDYVLKELATYSPLVSVGNYLVIHDTDLTGHPVTLDFTPGPGKEGPMEAVVEFLAKNPNFVADKSREKFGFTLSPNGWLKRIR